MFYKVLVALCVLAIIKSCESGNTDGATNDQGRMFRVLVKREANGVDFPTIKCASGYTLIRKTKLLNLNLNGNVSYRNLITKATLCTPVEVITCFSRKIANVSLKDKLLITLIPYNYFYLLNCHSCSADGSVFSCQGNISRNVLKDFGGAVPTRDHQELREHKQRWR